MTGLKTVEPVSGVELLQNMADQNMVVFSDWLERLSYSQQKRTKQLEKNETIEYRKNVK